MEKNGEKIEGHNGSLFWELSGNLDCIGLGSGFFITYVDDLEKSRSIQFLYLFLMTISIISRKSFLWSFFEENKLNAGHSMCFEPDCGRLQPNVRVRALLVQLLEEAKQMHILEKVCGSVRMDGLQII